MQNNKQFRHPEQRTGSIEVVDRKNNFGWKFAASMLAYVVVVIVVILVLKNVDIPQTWLRYIIAFLPVIPVLVGLRAISQAFKFLDEMQRAIQLESLAISLGGTVAVALTLGFLENAGLPRLNWTWLMPIACAIWGISQVISGRRYR